MIENSLWEEKYRPQTLDEYVGNEDFVGKLKIWLEQGDVPSLLLHASQPGTGKTTAAKIIGKTLDADVMYINASDENSVDVIRDKIRGFASSVGFSKWKIVILDEADFTTPNFQAALRNVLETFSKTTRFILTANYIERLIDPIVSRLVSFHIQPPSKTAVAKRLVYILDQEHISYNIDDIKTIVTQYYPDIRKIIKSAQRNSMNGVLTLDNQSYVVANYCSKILEQLQNLNDIKSAFTNIRQIIADSKVRQFEELFRFLFDNIDQFAGIGKVAQTILHIADAQYKCSLVVDKEIIVAAMFINILKDLK